jgi:N-acetylglucosaminyldiphosphoundecaprenol N-acetyl-beta-D-mannosaminyltransferase
LIFLPPTSLPSFGKTRARVTRASRIGLIQERGAINGSNQAPCLALRTTLILKCLTRRSESINNRVDILGYRVSRVDMNETIALIEQFIASGEFHHVVVGNLYCLIQSRQDLEFQEIANSSDLTVADGMSLVWASRLLGEPVGGRVSGWDLFDLFTPIAAQKGYSFFLVGGGPGGSEMVAKALKAKLPALRILGTYSPELGPISDEENEKIVALVNVASPDVLWVGLGAPRQEQWIWRNRSRLNTRVAIGVGSAFDFQMGRQKRAPTWMRQHCLEWLHRPTQDPSLLWRKQYGRWFSQGVFPILWEVIKRRALVRHGR